jgi:hypothetical protein
MSNVNSSVRVAFMSANVENGERAVDQTLGQMYLYLIPHTDKVVGLTISPISAQTTCCVYNVHWSMH